MCQPTKEDVMNTSEIHTAILLLREDAELVREIRSHIREMAKAVAKGDTVIFIPTTEIEKKFAGRKSRQALDALVLSVLMFMTLNDELSLFVRFQPKSK